MSQDDCVIDHHHDICNTLAFNHSNDDGSLFLAHDAHGCDDDTVCDDAFCNVCHGGRDSGGARFFSGGDDTWAAGNNRARDGGHRFADKPHVAAAGAEPMADGVQGKGCAGR